MFVRACTASVNGGYNGDDSSASIGVVAATEVIDSPIAGMAMLSKDVPTILSASPHLIKCSANRRGGVNERRCPSSAVLTTASA